MRSAAVFTPSSSQRPGLDYSSKGVKSTFLGGSTFDVLFESGLDREMPDRLWTSAIADVETRSPWSELEIKLLEVKGLGALKDVRT